MSEITSLSISELRAELSEKKVSSVEITKAFLEKSSKNKALNAYTEILSEQAIACAKEADNKIKAGIKSPLLGIPGAIKDIILTKNIRTTCCSKILSNFIPPYNATVIEKLNGSGFVQLGKTNMDEFAMGSSSETSFFGPVKNPWDKDRVPGGSSGGSAAAVSARLSPFALGTDTGGSIRQPASFCGIVGIKPTYGRVSRYGVIAFASSLDQVGVFAHNVRDSAIVTQVISGVDKNDSTSVRKDVPNFEAVLGQSIKGLKIGVPKEYFISGLDPEVNEKIKTAISVLSKLGAEIIDISLPNTEAAVAVYYILAPAEASSNLARFDGIRYGYRAKDTKNLKELYFKTRSEGFGKEVKRRIMIGTYVLSSGYFDAYYLRAQKVRTLIAHDFKAVFEKKCDIILSPTAPTTAFKIGEKVSDPLSMYLNDIFTIPVNLAGLPGMSIPCGFDSKGLPVGLQLIGKPWDEETLFKTAYAYESQTRFNKSLPNL